MAVQIQEQQQELRETFPLAVLLQLGRPSGFSVSLLVLRPPGGQRPQSPSCQPPVLQNWALYYLMQQSRMHHGIPELSGWEETLKLIWFQPLPQAGMPPTPRCLMLSPGAFGKLCKQTFSISSIVQ